MSSSETPDKTATDPAVLEGGSYEIIRNRLLGHAEDLENRLNRLNASRKEIFGAIEQTLLATERITTRNNCIPRDMVAIGGGRFLFGYNVHMGLKSEIQISDLFSVYAYAARKFQKLSWDLLDSGRFEADLKQLYKYYRDTRFAKFSIIGPHLFMVFRVGKSVTDIKTFKWLIQEDAITYLDNRSDHEFRPTPRQDFQWTRTSRDMHRTGLHPHISIQDRVFVEAVGGDITFKVEDNTDTGQGIYAEPVENPDQTLDDAEIHYAFLGHLILVRIKPYGENLARHFIFNGKTETVHRVDEIREACVLLPDDHGLIFSNGYYLQTGELKRFENGLTGMTFEERIASPNGEDYLYIFYHPDSGDYILLSYNIIAQQVATPIPCNGHSRFDNGEMIFFRAAETPARHHVIRIWQTPYVSGSFAFAEKSDAFLYKVGNPDIVRCMAECGELIKLIRRDSPYAGLYVDLVKKAGDIADAYFWIDRGEAFEIKSALLAVKDTASAAIEAFEKVVGIRRATAAEVGRVTEKSRRILNRLRPSEMEAIDLFVTALTELREVQGEIVSLKELRYVDLNAVAGLETEVADATKEMAAGCVEFLLRPDALQPYEDRVTETSREIASLRTAADAGALAERVDGASSELEMLIEIVSNLEISDATRTTRIIDAISAIYSRLNTVRAELRTTRKRLQEAEGGAQFNARIKLLNQSVINYLDICDTPEKCDEYLTRVMVGIEELEGQFTDFDAYVTQLAEKRESVYAAFESRKLALREARSRRAASLMAAAERILAGIRGRVSGMDEINAVNGYFASDLMVGKLRGIVADLLEIDDTVKADDIQSRLKTIREDTIRQIKDRQDLFEDGASIIRFGSHRFSVNVQPLDLTIVHREGRQTFHLTGTDFFEEITDPAFNETAPVWEMTTVSENRAVYRGEYLAYQMMREMDAENPDTPLPSGDGAPAAWLELVQAFMGPRYDEGYTKGVHDRDGAAILQHLMPIHRNLGRLRFHPRARALAQLFWTVCLAPETKGETRTSLVDKIRGFGVMRTLFPDPGAQENDIRELESRITDWIGRHPLFPQALAGEAARYLFDELVRSDADAGVRFVASAAAFEAAGRFARHLQNKRFAEKFADSRKALGAAPASEYELVRDWVAAFAATREREALEDYLDEIAVILFRGEATKADVREIPLSADIDGMTGDHPVITGGIYHLDYYRFMEKLTGYAQEVVPRFRQYTALKKRLTAEKRTALRLTEFQPRVLTSFVRNKLINDVYLPLIGDNLAKQIGVAGEAKRTDRMGMLLLISPPGYGKTTLMEYIANRLGIIFMKINGPAIGYRVTSLDPAEAPNAAAREEVEKLNLSLEMGDNVMIYLDDIQHCNPEFLQKFISLCDAQRKIEGVYNGVSRTYDLRGKKVAVVMAGNPYTESGEKFRIPDMLANRADTYNLGDIIGDTAETFKLSYIENALTANPVLNTLYSRSHRDIHGVIQIARTGDQEGVEFEGRYSPEEIGEMVSVMQKMMVVRDVILTVNLAYIHSAAQADAYRTEPPFKLQGSYRNMNRMAGKVLPLMNDAELDTLILSHYESEAQTLTTGAEANLLKFKELTGRITDAERQRWAEIKKTFMKNQLLHGADAADPVMQVVAQLSGFHDGLQSIREAITAGLTRTEGATRVSFAPEVESRMARLAETLAASRDAPDSHGRQMETLTRIVRDQFQLMNNWLEPGLKATQHQSRVVQSLARQIQDLKSVYRELMQGGRDQGWREIEQYDTALKLNPGDHATYYKRGLAWYHRNKVARALGDFKNALDLQPKNRKYQRIVAHLEAELSTDRVEPERDDKDPAT